ncbi:hypothetical protein M231_04889 [Tremella mesenterica]|uniref:Aspartate racemase n=1 Tax=Tremella mesenterica TaxID=5217 RepID=A0A4Q1BJU7_TREME|nr:uncharacterized protein TREMEDRAFT_35872 [Tremella mesenterica DSM 1558]EIW65832.1 hypothetical protein TREMEDRAFT_35872 [Tremella mesenterica DSM 1558]RXK37890.1 hypothetical protein M231_04889 [Tremella mesenterica]
MSTTVPKLGVLQLKTTFPRPPGDVGNALSWPMPVIIRIVEEATGDIVRGGTWGPAMVDGFVREGKKMMEEGCVAFVTSCGFLATMHPEIVHRLPSMGTSSLIQVGWLQKCFYPGEETPVGVVTFQKSALTKKHFISVGADPETPYFGLSESEDPKEAVFKAVLECRVPYDYEGMEKDVVGAALELVKAYPSVKAIVMECTNMPPFSHAVAKATGRKVWDILTLGKWLYDGATPRDYRGLAN